jgi:hypothetical protein
MAWLPPVNLPNLSQQKNYGAQLYDMISGVGDSIYQGRRDKVGDEQWQQEQERLLAAQALAQSNADRNYALEMDKFNADQANGSDETFFGTPRAYGIDTDGDGVNDGVGYAVPSNQGNVKALEAPDGAPWLPDVTTDDYGGFLRTRDKYGNIISNTPKTGAVSPDYNVTEVGPDGVPAAQAPRPGSKPAIEQTEVQRQRDTSIYNLKSETQKVSGFIDGAINKISPWTTGWGGMLAEIPGSEARSLANDLMTIKSNIGLGNLQELKLSGATLGQVTIFENQMLQAIDGALDQLARGEDVRQNLLLIKKTREEALRFIENAVGGGGGPQAPAGGGEIIDMPDGSQVEVLEE